MAYLVNRNTSSRLPCLHGVLRYLHHHWGNGPYKILNLKFDASRNPDLHSFSPCGITLEGISTCRYLENLLSPAGCGLVQSVDSDSQKSKSASDMLNALDGLGLVERLGDVATITDLGKAWVAAPYESSEWLEVASDAVSGYGPIVGMLSVLRDRGVGIPVTLSSIALGFPETVEEAIVGGSRVLLSTGSTKDTTTRTRAVLRNLAVGVGFLLPMVSKTELAFTPRSPAHLAAHDVVMAASSTSRYFQLTTAGEQAFPEEVRSPLSYPQLAKQAQSLRETGQSQARAATLAASPKILARRLAICYLLDAASRRGVSVHFPSLVSAVKSNDLLVVDPARIDQTMRSELGIARVAGIPFRVQGETLTPLNRVNLPVLTRGAPPELLVALGDIVSTGSVFADQ